jgi:outer membrane protein
MLMKVIRVGVVAVAFVFSFAAMAAPKGGLKETSKSGETLKGLKIAYLNLQQAIIETNEGKSARENLDREAKKRHEVLAKQEKEIRQLSEDFQSQSAVLTENAKNEKQRDLQKKYEDFQQARVSFENEFREREQKETGKILEKMLVIVEEYSKKSGIDLVFEQGTGALLYAAKIQDITTEIVAEFNKKHSVKK